MKTYTLHDALGQLPVSFEKQRLCDVLRQARGRARCQGRIIRVNLTNFNGPQPLHWIVHPDNRVTRHEK